MRPNPATFGVFCLLMVSGCVPEWSFLRRSPDKGLPPGKSYTAPELVSLINQNSEQLRSLTCQDVTVECSMGWQSAPTLRGRLACEQPRNFRLSANLTKQELEIGSNDHEFWFWIARNNPPAQFFCTYEDLKTKPIELPFPFQPEWVMEALGMANLPVEGQYQVRYSKDTVELVQETTSIQGQPVRKITVFDKDGTRVRGLKLCDAKNVEICSAQVVSVKRKDGVSVPYKLQLSMPEKKVQLHLQLNNPEINNVTPERAQFLFARQPLQGIPSYDLARIGPLRDNSRTIQPTGAYIR
ncbi:hypothetical protein BH10PLA2_BH10PLA2_06170 [soil metagenome]